MNPPVYGALYHSRVCHRMPAGLNGDQRVGVGAAGAL
jgi:hypothetical protein